MTLTKHSLFGMLAKAWRKNPLKREGIFLYKSGSKGCANCGNEPYSEFYAYQIARTMGLDVTPYSLAKKSLLLFGIGCYEIINH